jgi:DNA polymerase-3 subunit delta
MSKMPGVYLLLGPEAGEKQDFIDSVRAAIQKRTGEKPEEAKFYQFETPVAELLAQIRNGSLFAAHRLVLLEGVEQVRTKSDVEALVAYCGKPAEDVTLLLLSEEPQVDKRLSAAIPSDRRKIFWEMFDNQKLGWVTSYMRRLGCAISAEAANLLLELVENNTQELRVECDRLALFFGKDHEIQFADIEHFIYHSKEENVFTLFAEIAAANFLNALEILQKIMLGSDGNPVGIMAGLTWQFRRLLGVQILLDDRYAVHDAFQRMNIRSKRTQKDYDAGRQNYKRDALERIVLLAGKYDALLRRTASSLHPLLMQMFLYSVVVRKGAEAEVPDYERGEYEL